MNDHIDEIQENPLQAGQTLLAPDSGILLPCPVNDGVGNGFYLSVGFTGADDEIIRHVRKTRQIQDFDVLCFFRQRKVRK